MHRGSVRRGARRVCLATAAVGLALVVGVAPAVAQAPSSGPQLTGSVSGNLVKGAPVTFTLRATQPGGWQKLRTMQVTMLLHGLILSQMTYLQDFDAITIRGGPLIRLGTDESLDGSFFRINGLDVLTLTSGDRLDLTIRARVRQDLPDGAEFRLTATDDTGASASITKSVVLPKADEAGGFGWGTLAAAVLAALFAGGLIGGVFAARRRPAPSLSVYTAIRRQMDEQRTKG